MAVIIQKRRGTAAAWTAVNPILAQGEEGFETDTKFEKIGDGTTAWNLLPYKSSGGGGTGTVESVTGDGVDNTDPDNPVISFPDAGEVTFTPAGNLASVEVQAAIEELDGEKQAISEKGVANGYAGLDVTGKVPSAQLPSYVDDVVEVANFAALPVTGETGKIYITLDTNFQYRWSGSVYIEIVSSPGTTDDVPEGSTNLYHTAARVRAVVLTGLSFAVGTAITAADTILVAFGKLQKQITDALAAIPSTTDNLTEGGTRLYFTEARVRATVLTGLAAGANAVIVAGDSVLGALEKLQAQITAGGATVASQVETDAGVNDTKFVSPLKLFGKFKAKTSTAAAFNVDATNDLKTIIATPAGPINATINSASTDVIVAVHNYGSGTITFVNGTATFAGISSLLPNKAALIRYTAAGTAVIIGGSTISFTNVTAKPTTTLGYGITDASRSIFATGATVSSVGTTETTLATGNIPANTLGADLGHIRSVFVGQFGASGNNKTLKVKLGATTIYDSGAIPVAGAIDFEIQIKIMRTASNAQRGSITLYSNSGTVAGMKYFTAAEDLTTLLALAVTGQVASPGGTEISGNMFYAVKEGI